MRTRLTAACICTLLFLAGCPSTPSPMVQIYAARQTYTGTLNALTTAINAGQITDRQTLTKIRDLRAEIEKGLDKAESKARAGDKVGASFLYQQVTDWLEEYLILSTPRPATRPTSSNTETPWTRQRSLPSSSVAAKLLPDWYRPTKPLPVAANSPRNRWEASVRSRLLLRPETTPR